MARSTAPSLDPAEIVATIGTLGRRIQERFPDSGLASVCLDLQEIAERAQARAEWIARPILGLRVAAGTLVAAIVTGLVVTGLSVDLPDGRMDLAQFVQLLESGINDVVLIGAAIFFLLTAEARVKRHRGLAAIHELRAIAHIIDMHQLTKDPERVHSGAPATASSPRRRQMTPDELGRYLDYCSEMLSLTGKVAAIYVQDFDDGVALAAVNEVESLTTGLSRKIWQKLIVLHGVESVGVRRSDAA